MPRIREPCVQGNKAHHIAFSDIQNSHLYNKKTFNSGRTSLFNFVLPTGFQNYLRVDNIFLTWNTTSEHPAELGSLPAWVHLL